jgi:hypothetical protein
MQSLSGQTSSRKELKMTTSRHELEINLGWANQHPQLFFESVRKFHEETRHLTNKFVDTSRAGFVTYIANKG